MSDNNSSAFNFRFISHTTKISKHGMGMAVDINTLYNPYVKTVDGELFRLSLQMPQIMLTGAGIFAQD